ncbi:tetratricopeptide repeat protein [Breznakiella homolactica]|uniref:Sel1 repeat family protein n=1 Tax=Breznakiella homolactica TaxID=2798577 RepID=A0A7T8BA47_9SPIR|nr:tetratricopeptide repeat protein [Breznakiella homolactica]QQO07848.1 sel1 repeat family protein [Breznakiella homolactica]
MKKTLALFAIVSVVCVSAGGDMPDKETENHGARELFALAEEYFQKGDDAEAVTFYQKAADLGHADAIYKLGGHYYSGSGVRRDFQKAYDLYSKAAELGNADALYQLGHIHQYARSSTNGIGIPFDINTAIAFYTDAAELGHPLAQDALAALYFKGGDVEGDLEQDYAQALKWYRVRAEAGDSFGQYMVGECYYCGHGVAQDFMAAFEWYTLSAEQDPHSPALYKLYLMYFKGEGVPQDYEKANEWYKKMLSDQLLI